MKTLFRFLMLLSAGFFLANCSWNKNQAEKEASANHFTCPMHPQVIQDNPGACPICGMDLVKMSSSGGDPDAIVLTDRQIRLANISTTLTRTENIGSKTIITGRLAVNQEQTAVVSSRVQGRIERLFLKEAGQRVVAGQALYEIYSEELLTLQREYLLTLEQKEALNQPQYESFFRAAERKLILFGMTPEQVQQLASRKRTESRITFLSPASGVIASMDVVEGQYVSEGSVLYSIAKLDKVWVEAECYPGESPNIRIGDPVQVQIGGFENSPVPGKITFLSPEYRQGSQITTIRVVIDNPDRQFLPGMLANVILSGTARNAIAIPVDAVIRDEHGSHVWILQQDGSYKPRMVSTGMNNVDKVEITRGLQEKENVVISGAYLLYSDWVLKKGGDPGMHQHQH